jgi:hypothetical protein
VTRGVWLLRKERGFRATAVEWDLVVSCRVCWLETSSGALATLVVVVVLEVLLRGYEGGEGINTSFDMIHDC